MTVSVINFRMSEATQLDSSLHNNAQERNVPFLVFSKKSGRGAGGACVHVCVHMCTRVYVYVCVQREIVRIRIHTQVMKRKAIRLPATAGPMLYQPI